MAGSRDRILDAAAHLMRSRGLVRTTTKEIAAGAGYSEAMLYKHFRDKTDLVLAVLAERLPSFAAVAGQLPERVGTAPIAATLTDVVRGGLGFYAQSFAIFASIFSEPDVLVGYRAAMAARGAGPHHPLQAVAGYLAAEQAAGRIRPDADPEAVASMLLGACMLHAVLDNFAGRTVPAEELDRLAAAVVAPLLPGLLTENFQGHGPEGAGAG